MLVFLSTLFGLLSSTLPLIIKYFYLIKTHNYQTSHLDTVSQIFNKISKHDSNADFLKILKYNSNARIVNSSSSSEGFTFVLQSLIRPVIAIFFCSLYIYIKYLYWCFIMASPQHSIQALAKLWNSDDAIMFSMIISFYFGSRVFCLYKF